MNELHTRKFVFIYWLIIIICYWNLQEQPILSKCILDKLCHKHVFINPFSKSFINFFIRPWIRKRHSYNISMNCDKYIGYTFYNYAIYFHIVGSVRHLFTYKRPLHLEPWTLNPYREQCLNLQMSSHYIVHYIWIPI